MTVPVWGCPWHGLVRGGQLSLPNGASMSYPQPGPSTYPVTGGTAVAPDTYGSTHLHAAGMPVIVRGESETASDAASGRQWRNQATLSGGRLHIHGQRLDGWIYVDPEGARWLVRCAQLQGEPSIDPGSTISAIIQLIRFGVLGGAAKEYSYAVPIQFGYTGFLNSAAIALDAISPTGDRAVVMMFRRSTTRQLLRQPEGFAEISISGNGRSATISSAVIRNNEQINSATEKLSSTRWWIADDQWTSTMPPGATFSDSLIEASGSGQRIFSSTVCFWYDASGVIRELSFRAVVDFMLSMPRPNVPAPEENFPAWSSFVSLSGSAQLALDGVAVSSVPIAAEISMTFTPSSGSYDYGEIAFSYSVTVDGATGSGATSYLRNGVGAPYPEISLLTSLSAINSGAAAPVLTMGQPATGSELNPAGLAIMQRFVIGSYAYSRQVVGLEVSSETGAGTNPETRVWESHPPATPSGQALGVKKQRAIAVPPPYYGSRDPYTGDAVWYESAPVCYV